MSNINSYVCYVQNGTLYGAYSNNSIGNPSILIYGPDDMIMKWGNYDKLQPHFDRYVRSYAAVGEDDSTKVQLINLSALTVDEQCYIINRMITYTATGFVEAFAEHIFKPDALDWLHAEMQRFPRPLVKL